MNMVDACILVKDSFGNILVWLLDVLFLNLIYKWLNIKVKSISIFHTNI